MFPYAFRKACTVRREQKIGAPAVDQLSGIRHAEQTIDFNDARAIHR